MDTPPRQAAFRLLFAALAMVGVGNSMLFAVLPPLAREMGLPDIAVGAIFSFSAVLWVATSPLWGRASDRVGRKPLIVFGLSAYAASMICFAGVVILGLAGHWRWEAVFVALLVARALFGAGGSATNPAAQAYVADLTPPESRTRELAALTSAFAFGSAAGPALAAMLVSAFGLTAPLIVVGALAGLGALAAQLALPPARTLAERSISGPEVSPWRLARDPRVAPYLVYGVLLSAVTAAMFQTVSFFAMDRLGLAPKAAAEMTAIALSAGALAQIAAQLGLINRLTLGPRGLMISGALVTAAAALLMALGASFAALATAQIIAGLGFGLARPGFSGGASLAVGRDEQGGVAGLVVAANGAGFVAAPLFGVGLQQMAGPSAPYWLVTAILLVMAVYAFWHPVLKAGPERPAPDQPMDQP